MRLNLKLNCNYKNKKYFKNSENLIMTIQYRLLLAISLFSFLVYFSGCSATDKAYREIKRQRKLQLFKPKIIENLIIDTTTLIHDIKYLSADSLGGRYPGAKGSLIAQEFILSRLKMLKIDSQYISYKQKYYFLSKENTNIIGFIRGKIFPDSNIIISAHYDHLGIFNGEIYNGADDNASGVCGLLAIAQFFSINKPNHTLIFCFFDGEEQSLSGSQYFVNNSPVNLSSIKININLDMISRNDTYNEIVACGSNHFSKVKKIIAPLRDSTNIGITFGFDKPVNTSNKIDDWTGQSDHFSFFQKGIPFVYLGVIDHPDYHEPTDDFEKIDLGFYGSVVNLATKIVLAFDKY